MLWISKHVLKIKALSNAAPEIISFHYTRVARYIMCASLACQVWLNISSLARRRRHRRATVRSMRLPSVIVKKGKVVLVVVATWEQQNISWKHHCIETQKILSEQ